MNRCFLIFKYKINIKIKITRTSGDILAVADWAQKLSFYQLNGKQVNSIYLNEILF